MLETCWYITLLCVITCHVWCRTSPMMLRRCLWDHVDKGHAECILCCVNHRHVSWCAMISYNAKIMYAICSRYSCPSGVWYVHACVHTWTSSPIPWNYEYLEWSSTSRMCKAWQPQFDRCIICIHLYKNIHIYVHKYIIITWWTII